MAGPQPRCRPHAKILHRRLPPRSRRSRQSHWPAPRAPPPAQSDRTSRLRAQCRLHLRRSAPQRRTHHSLRSGRSRHRFRHRPARRGVGRHGTRMTPAKRVAILSPVAWRTPPRQYGAWETVAGNIAEGLVSRGWDVTLFASGDSITSAHLHAVVEHGYEEDRTIDPKVAEYLHISEAFEYAASFDLIHSHYDFMALAYTRLVKTPVLTTIHGFSSPKIMPVYEKYRDGYFVSISNSDRAPGLNYLATVYDGIDLSLYPLLESGGRHLVFLGRIHPDKGVHLAIEVARLSGLPLLIALIRSEEHTSELQSL